MKRFSITVDMFKQLRYIVIVLNMFKQVKGGKLWESI
jgi:hypothetical protein